MHWAAEYILRNPPIRWESGAQGPDAFDCWAFFRYIQREHFGVDLPLIRVDADDAVSVKSEYQNIQNYHGWVPVENPREGDGVVFLGGKEENHIGVWLDADMGGILHCMRKSGVVFTRREAVRRLGWGRIEFFRRVDESCLLK